MRLDEKNTVLDSRSLKQLLSSRDQGNALSGKRTWAAVLCGFLLLFPALHGMAGPRVTSPSTDIARSPKTFALLVASHAYGGSENMRKLEYSDDDVLRFALLLTGLKEPPTTYVLMDPKESVRAWMETQRYPDARTPSKTEFLRTLKLMTDDARNAREQGNLVHSILFISAHGEPKGLYLSDGLLEANLLKSAVERLAQASDRLLIVTDACYSSQWGLKGSDDGQEHKTEARLDSKEIAKAMETLERTGAITAQTVLREERNYLKGGVLTHVVTSGLAGAADFNHNARIEYDELEAFLRRYAYAYDPSAGIDVFYSGDLGWPGVALDLNALEGQGIRFVRRAPRGLRIPGGYECFWIHALGQEPKADRMVAEFCRWLDEDDTMLHLPPGRYRVNRRTPDDWLSGEKGEVVVTTGSPAVVTRSTLKDWWYLDAQKSSLQQTTGNTGESKADPESAPQDEAMLEGPEAAYIEHSPFLHPAGWTDLADTWQSKVWLEAALPLRLGLQGISDEAWTDSTFREKPSAFVATALERRLGYLRTGYSVLGADVGVGYTPSTGLVGLSEPGALVQVRYRGRLGIERPVFFGNLRSHLFAGGMLGFYSVVDDTGVGASGVEDTGSVLGGIGAASAFVAGTEISFAWRGPARTALEIGIGADVAVEALQNESEVRIYPYPALVLTAGGRW